MRSRASSLSFQSLMWPSQSRKRPRISAPMDFRHVAGSNAAVPRKPGHRKLELSIYCKPSARLSDLPDFNTCDWERKLEEIRQPPPAFLRNQTEPEIERAFDVPRKPMSMVSIARQSTYGEITGFDLSFENGPGPIVIDDEPEMVPSTEVRASSRTPLMMQQEIETVVTMRPSLQSHARSDSESTTQTMGSSPRGGRSWTPSDFARHIRSKSSRQEKPDDIDEAIRELNSIVEERRRSALDKEDQPDNSSALLSPTHVPAIAPSMKLRARSQTLSDIGSAFSVPLNSRAWPSKPQTAYDRKTSHLSPRSLSIKSQPGRLRQSSTNGTDVPSLPSPASRATTRSRLANWLGISSALTSPALPEDEQPTRFYQLQGPHPHLTSPTHIIRQSTFSVESDTISTISTPSEQSYCEPDAMTPATSIFSPVSARSPSSNGKKSVEDPFAQSGAAINDGSPRPSHSLRHKTQRVSRGLYSDQGARVCSPTFGRAQPTGNLQQQPEMVQTPYGQAL